MAEAMYQKQLRVLCCYAEFKPLYATQFYGTKHWSLCVYLVAINVHNQPEKFRPLRDANDI
jgi:hypothetical protein